MEKQSQIGVITEQGDFGLGFNPIEEKERKVVQEHTERQNKEDK